METSVRSNWRYVMAMVAFCGIMACCAVVLGMFGNAYGQAQTVNAQWDANTEPDLAGYRLYWSQTPGTYGIDKMFEIPVGDFVPSPGVNDVNTGWLTVSQWYFVATAYDEAGNESGYSNEATVDVPDVAPGPPTVIQWDLMLPDGTTIHMQIDIPYFE